MLVTITTLFGSVGLTATASSDSLPARWLTLTFAGVDGPSVVLSRLAAAAAPPLITTAHVARTAATTYVRGFMAPLPVQSLFSPSPDGTERDRAGCRRREVRRPAAGGRPRVAPPRSARSAGRGSPRRR